MNASELKYQYEKHNPQGYYFTRSSMRFAGDTMKNYGVTTATVNGREVWELYRRRPVKHGLQASAYFDKQTFAQVIKPIRG
jgi:hypothetical protein